ncbi:MAG: D-tyrosyl-tRNA(Tyr) deacylase [SAR202 cluster bacterium]|nr:D-tyrosyl-tRNA(Tyr) deacylase [SAR202 cluster bacterium]
MRALVQRVTWAIVTVGGEDVAHIGRGLAVLLGVGKEDAAEDAQYLADKITNLRIFPDAAARFNYSALDIGAEILLVSQFTLYGDTRKGRRPDFTSAAAPDKAQQLYLDTVERFRQTGLSVATGRFQEHMLVSLENDGPVTLMLDSAERLRSRRG